MNLFLVILVPVVILWLFSAHKISPAINNISTTVSDTIEEINEIKVAQLENAMNKLIKMGITGIPGVIESTNDRTLRYLQNNNHNITLALEKASARLGTSFDKVKDAALSAIPYVGLPYSLVHPYWKKVRYLLLVAKLYNHDINSDKVYDDIQACLTHSVINKIEQKVEYKIIGKVMSYADKLFGVKLLGKIASVPLSVLNVFLEKHNEVIECGQLKFSS
jgi:hypothetical protein